MSNSAPKRFIAPFLTQKGNATEIEATAVFAVAEFERNKGGGLIARQPEEKLVFLSKIGYPLWLFPKNETTFVFDGFGGSSHKISYTIVASTKTFMENLETNARSRENYTAFLSDHGNYFQQSMKEKQFVFRGLIVDLDLKSEFIVCRKEAIDAIPTNFALLPPTLEESKISSILSEFDKLQSVMKEEAERLPECKRCVNKTTRQYITELDYEADAVKEEANAKIKAQKEFINPQISKLNKEHNHKINNLSKSFDKELESLQKIKAKSLRFIEGNERIINLYQREAKAQGSKKHTIYLKRWKKKIKQTQKELNGLKKELKKIEGNIKKLSKQKVQEISRLNFELEAKIKLARQPLLELEANRDAKILTYTHETDNLLNQEKPVIEDLNKSIKLREVIKANFEALGIRDQGLKSIALFFVPFYVACYEMGLKRRYLILPPSTISTTGFSVKLKGALGISKIKNLLAPRFKAIKALIETVQVLTKQNTIFEKKLSDLSQRNNLLSNGLFLENAKEGLVYLNHEGWLSDKERQVVSRRLTG